MYNPQQRTLFSTLDHLVPKRLNLKHVAGAALGVFAIYHFIIVHTLSAQEEPLPMNALLRQYPHPAPHRDLNDVHRYTSNTSSKGTLPSVAPVIMYNHSGEYYSTPRDFFKKRYGLSDHRQMCEDNLGFGLVDRWRAAYGVSCRPKQGVPSDIATTVYTATIQQENHGIPNTFVDIRNFYLDFSLTRGSKGGENITEVWGRKEDEEYLKFGDGALGGVCDAVDQKMHPDNFQLHTKHWMASWGSRDANVQPTLIVEEPVFMVTRYEYANFYHTLTDFFNMYMALEVADLRPEQVKVVIMDGHPKAPFDDVWGKVYSPVFNMSRHSDYKGQHVLFRRAIFVQGGYEAPISTDWGVPNPCRNSDLVRAFSQQFLAAYNLTNIKPREDKINVLFIFREDYIAHPRESDKGRRRNKIQNEIAVAQLATLRDTEVEIANLALIPFEEQIALIRSKDIIVGMHGAGLSHTVFLPEEAALIELFPSYIKPRKQHFRNLAKWSNHAYFYFQNADPDNEVDFYTTKIEIDRMRGVVLAAIHLAENFGKWNGEFDSKCSP